MPPVERAHLYFVSTDQKILSQDYAKATHTSFPSKNIPLPSDIIKSSCETFPVFAWHCLASSISTVIIFSSWAIFVFFWSNLNCWRAQAPDSSVKGLSNGCTMFAFSPKLRQTQKLYLTLILQKIQKYLRRSHNLFITNNLSLLLEVLSNCDNFTVITILYNNDALTWDYKNNNKYQVTMS